MRLVPRHRRDARGRLPKKCKSPVSVSSPSSIASFARRRTRKPGACGPRPLSEIFSGSYFGLRIQRYLATMPVHVKILIYQYFEPYLLPGLSGPWSRSTVE
jgi:hypothetical protein